ncbi:MAG: VIT domain-containing protein [Akkermansiaceae bacterium]
MKALTLIGGLLLSACLTHAATPKMWVKDKNNRVPLRIDRIEADITITGIYAETVLTLRFRNETSRFQEGEFVMPLPDGATVSQYALEVNGSLRDAVAVEKKQARHAYETIKARKVDPGLVEREANNTYRTRVYPIPGKGTKLVRIGYIERIPTKEGKLHYNLPVNYPGKVDSFTCRVHSSGAAPIVSGTNLDFVREKPDLIEAAAKDVQLKGNITVKAPLPRNPKLRLEKHAGTDYFQLDFDLPADATERPRKKPNHIHLIWDASASCRGRDVSKELQLLDLYFKHIGDTRVTLKLLRNKIHTVGDFRIRNGNWKDLRRSVEGTFYDGSSAFHLIKNSGDSAPKPDLAILVTDGVSSDQIKLSQDWSTIILHRQNRQHLHRATQAGCGGAFNLTADKPVAALRALTHTRFRIKSAWAPSSFSNTIALPAGHVTQKRQSIAGTAAGKLQGNAKITYTNGNGDTLQQTVKLPNEHTNDTTSSVRRIWAQQHLLSLESGSSSQSEIIRHCRMHNLVSDHTSLIVLELFRDYVEFKIPPPEPSLRRKWDIAIKKQSNKEPHRNQINPAWAEKVSWNRRNFSWLPNTLIASYRQTEIWLNAIDTAFEKDEIDQRAYGLIETWRDKTQQLIEQQPKLSSNENLKKWLGKHNALIKQWNNLRNIKPKAPAGKKTAVSIRGLVNFPTTHRFEKAPTLKQSIKHAGGLHPYGSVQAVSLYRNAHATTYNIASRRYKDITLLPGDMIVVQPEPYSDEDGFSSDPFGDDSGDSATDPTSLPPIAQNQPRVSTGSGLHDPFGGGSGGGSPPNRREIKNTEVTSTVIPAPNPQVPVSLTDKQLRALEAALKSPKSAEAAYQKAIGKTRHFTADYASLARLLAKHGHKELATQALSNIPEDDAMSSASQRAFLYWLGELKLWAKALNTLNSHLYPKDMQRKLDNARYRHRGQSTDKEASEHHQGILVSQNAQTHLGHVLLTLTERNNRVNMAHPNNQKITGDIRCLVYSSDPDAGVEISVQEPMGNSTSGNSPSHLGGRIYKAPGISEYIIKSAMPGEYKLNFTCAHPATIQAIIYRNYGTTQQTSEWITLSAQPSQGSNITTISKEFPKR